MKALTSNDVALATASALQLCYDGRVVMLRRTSGYATTDD